MHVKSFGPKVFAKPLENLVDVPEEHEPPQNTRLVLVPAAQLCAPPFRGHGLKLDPQGLGVTAEHGATSHPNSCLPSLEGLRLGLHKFLE